MKKVIVFTDADLDGSMCYTLLKWCTTGNLPYKVTTVTKFRDDFIAWSRKNDVDSYDNIYILDLDVSQTSMDLVDKKNITIIDHHATHVDNRDKYKHAKVYVTEYPSCAKLIYKMFKKTLNETIDSNMKKLVLLVDDYDSWTHKFPQSKKLNYLFWNYQGDRLEKFLKDFQHGFKGFNEAQTSIIDFYEKKLIKVTSNLQYFQAETSIQKQQLRCVSTFVSTMISDIGNHLVDPKGLNADIGFVVNPETNRVSIRKNTNCTVHLGRLAQLLIDGGGHESAAGGVCTEKFLQFSKLFTPYVTR